MSVYFMTRLKEDIVRFTTSPRAVDYKLNLHIILHVFPVNNTADCLLDATKLRPGFSLKTAVYQCIGAASESSSRSVRLWTFV